MLTAPFVDDQLVFVDNEKFFTLNAYLLLLKAKVKNNIDAETKVIGFKRNETGKRETVIES